MERRLAEFVQLLRGARIDVGPAQAVDAARALTLTGMADRERARAVLAATLVKTADERPAFDACFDRFFRVAGQVDAEAGGTETTDETDEPVDAAPGAAGVTPGSGGGLARELETGDTAALEARLATAMAEARVDEARHWTQTGVYTQRVRQALDLAAVDDLIRARREAGEPAEQLARARAGFDARLRERVEQRVRMQAEAQAWSFRDRVLRQTPLSALDRRDQARMRELVRRLARRLAARHGRRRRRRKRGRLDAGATMRASLRWGGVPFRPVWKGRRRDRARVVVLCDVSQSVRAQATVLLPFVHALQDVLPEVRSFVFASDPAEVTTLFRHDPPERAMAEALARYGNGSTDYGGTLTQFDLLTRDLIQRQTTVVILGDGRNNYGDPALAALSRIADRCRELIWLNPEAEGSWGTGDSEMPAYARRCHQVLRCRTLRDLEWAVMQLLRRAG
ncbi:VWA domain-containing protein [Aquisalimonas lutea]|uniref:VWA domain-containing protein n=1 Tax=Aquisalimonas lutea TaxID=1327750 RepID=UPI0025B502D1|nr:VWA domain-containing protein [Aquisalimonas lutea]MDN3518017.1 VWA domain-containing protein [Aquisalimonas lutea]